MALTITVFSGANRFLSNFHPVEVKLEGVTYPTVEHAYQAAKCEGSDDREAFVGITAKEAKARGRKVRLRSEWEEIKLQVMEDLLRQKFAPNTSLADKLLDTGGDELIEGNWWGDRYWGQCPVGTGENHLGKLLMKIRKELRNVT